MVATLCAFTVCSHLSEPPPPRPPTCAICCMVSLEIDLKMVRVQKPIKGSGAIRAKLGMA